MKDLARLAPYRRIFEFDGGLGDVASEDVWGDGGPPRSDLGQFVSVLIVLARDMIELEAVEFVFEAAYRVAESRDN